MLLCHLKPTRPFVRWQKLSYQQTQFLTRRTKSMYRPSSANRDWLAIGNSKLWLFSASDCEKFFLSIGTTVYHWTPSLTLPLGRKLRDCIGHLVSSTTP